MVSASAEVRTAGPARAAASGIRQALPLLLATALAWPAHACQRAGNTRPLPPALDRVQRAGVVDLYYADQGLRRAPRADDADGDGRVDKIQNFTAQLQAATLVFNDLFQTSGPPAFPRYREVVAIQGLVLPMERLNGQAFSEPYFDPAAAGRGGCVLRFHVADDVGPRNLTPAHELFHLYHYAHTNIQRGWLREGAARWAETAFRGGAGKTAPLPQTPDALRALMNETYQAGLMWNRLVQILDPDAGYRLPAQARQLRYVGGLTVVAGERLRGALFMRDLFRALREASATIERDTGRAPDGWTRAQRHDPALDAVIWSAVRKVAAEHARRVPASPELQGFLALQPAPVKAEPVPR